MANYLIIGASSGIGFSIALHLANAGNNVFGIFNKKIQSEHQNIKYNMINVHDDKISFEYLPESLNGIVYCPGSINLRPFVSIKFEDIIKDYKLQLAGAIKVIQSVISKLKNSENAAILLFSNVAVQTGLPYHSQVSVSKGAIEGLTKALTAEYAPKIRVNCIAPSIIETPLSANLLNSEQKKKINAQRHPLKRIGTPDDIAYMASFLLSEKASWITS